jgi:putative ABC transport system ATP-binding protein
VNNDIHFSARNGELIVIQGNSGAGKSTLLNIITGLDRADSGVIRWDTYKLMNMTAAKRDKFRLENCGIVFQFFELLHTQTAYNNAALPLKLKGKTNHEIREILFPLFEKYDVLKIKDKKTHLLSGGEKQRVAIIRALCGQPRFIIADEITASLNEELSKMVYDDLKNAVKCRNGVGIFVTHDPVMVPYMDTMYTMAGGKLEKES